MKIAITGGAGFIGTELTKHLLAKGHEVVILDLSRPKISGQGLTSFVVDLSKEAAPQAVASCDAIVHLAGVNIFGKWTPPYKELILKSRTESAKALINFLSSTPHQIKTFISASAIGYYGDTGETATDESGNNGSDFLATVCKQWEDEVAKAQTLGIRTVSVRTGIVLGKNGGMLQKLIPVFSWGVGGKIGNGKQWFSWISLNDLVRVYETVITDNRFTGAVNAVSPNPVRNSDLTKALGKALHRPTVFPVPSFFLKIGLGELAGAILQSSRITPKKLLGASFTFQEPTLENVLTELKH